MSFFINIFSSIRERIHGIFIVTDVLSSTTALEVSLETDLYLDSFIPVELC